MFIIYKTTLPKLCKQVNIYNFVEEVQSVFFFIQYLNSITYQIVIHNVVQNSHLSLFEIKVEQGKKYPVKSQSINIIRLQKLINLSGNLKTLVPF